MPYTVTTPLYYVNDKPHLGSTYTTIACDAISRHQRSIGQSVCFITGVDEHGLKIQRTAALKNIPPQEHCDQISSTYEQLWNQWSITSDKFIRTTDIKHISVVEQFFKLVYQSGDIYMGRQKGWYCVGCEEYKDVPVTDDKPECNIHKKKLEWRDEENLFFRLSKFQKDIEELISKDSFILPKTRRKEIQNFVKSGLKDFSISRVGLSWGIPVPGHLDHTFYVWFDALVGYLSALVAQSDDPQLSDVTLLGWPASIHVIGKDILRFHAVYWPAMLLSAGLPLPRSVFAHGFLTREGAKMGKSLGNVLDPAQLLTEYGSDRIRWYLLKDIGFGNDGDFQQKRFIDLVNNDLANVIGNLINRTSSMSRKWFNDCVPNIKISTIKDHYLAHKSNESMSNYLKYMDSIELHSAASEILILASHANLYLNECEPWKLIKDTENIGRVAIDIYSVLETSRIIGLLLHPFTPSISKRLLTQLSQDHLEISIEKFGYWGSLEPGLSLPNPSPVISRLENDSI